jgi:hypothetical protein
VVGGEAGELDGTGERLAAVSLHQDAQVNLLYFSSERTRRAW